MVYYVDDSHLFKADTSKFTFIAIKNSIANAKDVLQKGRTSLWITTRSSFTLSHPKGFTLYTKSEC